MKYARLGYFSLFLAVIMMMSSCGTETKKEESVTTADDFEEAESDVKDQIQEVVYEIPSPSEIPFLLEATGAEYNGSLLHDEDRASEYMSLNDKAALNLGVYATDIGYLVSYDKVQEALNYMATSKKLADNMGITGAFDATLIKRFEDNLSRKDSLAYLLNSTIQQTEKYLKDDNRNRLASLIVAGSFIEGLYISTQLIKTYPKDILPEDSRNLVLTPLIRVVLEQKKATDDLARLMKTIDSSQPVDQLVADLDALNKSYAELNIDEQIKNNRADLVLTDKTLASITEKVAQMRSGLVK